MFFYLPQSCMSVPGQRNDVIKVSTTPIITLSILLRPLATPPDRSKSPHASRAATSHLDSGAGVAGRWCREVSCSHLVEAEVQVNTL